MPSDAKRLIASFGEKPVRVDEAFWIRREHSVLLVYNADREIGEITESGLILCVASLNKDNTTLWNRLLSGQTVLFAPKTFDARSISRRGLTVTITRPSGDTEKIRITTDLKHIQIAERKREGT